jgi:PKD repeat protein
MANIDILNSDVEIVRNSTAQVTLEDYASLTITSFKLIDTETLYEIEQQGINFNTGTGVVEYTVTQGILPYSDELILRITLSDDQVLDLNDVTLLPVTGNTVVTLFDSIVTDTTSIFRYSGDVPEMGYQIDYPEVFDTNWQVTVNDDTTYELLWTDSEYPSTTPLVLPIRVWNGYFWTEYDLTLDVTYPIINAIPVADFEYTTEGLTFFGDASISTDADIDAELTYAWDFGDGNTATTLEVEHTYALAGDYNVTLVVSDGIDESDPEIKSITVENIIILDPIAEFSYNVNILDINVDASLSFNPNDETLVFTWDFGDGSDLVTGVTQNHTYSLAGTYDVVLSMYNDEDDLLDTETKSIVISADLSGITTVNGGVPIVAGETFTIETQGFNVDNIHFIILSASGYSAQLPKLSVEDSNTITVLAPVDLPVTDNLTISIRVWKQSSSTEINSGLVWSEVEKSENFVAPINTGHLVDTRSSVVAMILPQNPPIGAIIKYLDVYGSFEDNNFIIDPNGNNLYGDTENYISNSNNESGTLFYTGATQGWKFIDVSPTI